MLSSFSLTADEGDYDNFDDLDFDFSVRQKSTLNDFPMQEIDQEELSNAAIAGALQTGTTNNELPAYKQIQDENEKLKKNDLDEKNNKENSDDVLKFSQISEPASPFQQPVYSAPNGRTYGAHNTTTVERY